MSFRLPSEERHTTKRKDKQQMPSIGIHVLEKAVDRKDTLEVLRAG